MVTTAVVRQAHLLANSLLPFWVRGRYLSTSWVRQRTAQLHRALLTAVCLPQTLSKTGASAAQLQEEVEAGQDSAGMCVRFQRVLSTSGVFNTEAHIKLS